MNLESKELANIVGGTISAAFLNAVLNIGKTIFELGSQLGRNIRRMIFG